MSLSITKLLETEGIKADISAGLSLENTSALINSKAITIEDGLNIVKARGQVHARAYAQKVIGKWQQSWG